MKAALTKIITELLNEALKWFHKLEINNNFSAENKLKKSFSPCESYAVKELYYQGFYVVISML